jgi:hypothetical protein
MEANDRRRGVLEKTFADCLVLIGEILAQEGEWERPVEIM